MKVNTEGTDRMQSGGLLEEMHLDPKLPANESHTVLLSISYPAEELL
jgi:hypothetical protein